MTVANDLQGARLLLLLCCAIGVLALAGLRRLSVHRNAGRLRLRLEERSGGRESTSGKLHDDLLQGVQGLVLHLQSVADDMPSKAPTRLRMIAALDRADEVIKEGRERVHALRQSEVSRAFDVAVATIAERVLGRTDMDVTFTVTGRRRDVELGVAHELVWIVDEAVRNVRMHAGAQNVAIAVSYGLHKLGVRIEDDGIGMSNDSLSGGWPAAGDGMRGMQERVNRMGGTLLVTSGRQSGTQVVATVTARQAYSGLAANWIAWIGGFFRDPAG